MLTDFPLVLPIGIVIAQGRLFPLVSPLEAGVIDR